MIVSFENPNQDTENWSPRALSSVIAQRQVSGEDVKDLLFAPAPIDLHPDEENSCTAAKQSPTKKPKNHLRANRRALREKQRNNKDAEVERQAQERLRLHKLDLKKQKLYGKVRSRVFDPAPSPPAADSHNMSSPTKSVSAESHIAFGRKVPLPPSGPQTGAESVASASSGGRHKSYGKVPSYITQRRAKIEREEEERRRIAANAPPEPGLRLMEESERLETLKMLDENEREARESLRNIPFSMNHQRAARLREAIDYRLKEIEDTRKIFSKERVFVSEE